MNAFTGFAIASAIMYMSSAGATRFIMGCTTFFFGIVGILIEVADRAARNKGDAS